MDSEELYIYRGKVIPKQEAITKTQEIFSSKEAYIC